MSYLAAAQYFGLEGLWQKLCAGKLPERCSKQWYFATFCSMDADAFEEGAYDELGASADIGAHLNGFVKPYDVIALMTVLPVSKQLFPQSALFEHRGVQHLLLLEEKHAVRALPVVNLLRETYHEVVLVTTARRNAGMATPAGKINVRRFNLQAMLGSTAGGGLASRRQLLQQGKQKQQGKAPAKALRAERYALNKPACTSSTQISDGASPRKSASHALGPVSDDGDVGHAQEREYSAVISHDDIVELLSNVLALAGQRQRAITTATLAIGCTLVVACFTAFAASVLVTEWLTPVQVEIAHTSTGACALTGGAFVHLSLSPTPAHRARIRLVAIAFGAFVGTAWALDDEKARLLRTVMPGYAPEYAAIDPANTRFFVAYSVVHALVHNLTWGGSSFALIALAIASRFTRQVSTRLLLCALWAHLGGASLFLAISRSVSNTLNYSAGTWVYANAQDQAHALFVFNAVIGPLLLAQAVATQFAGFRHSLIRLISQTSSALGTEASVAPLLGFGSRRGERAPEDVCDEAERAFLPRALEPALLAEIEAAGLGVHLHTAPLPRRPFSRSKRVGRVANSSLTTMASGPASSHAGGADSCDLAQLAQVGGPQHALVGLQAAATVALSPKLVQRHVKMERTPRADALSPPADDTICALSDPSPHCGKTDASGAAGDALGEPSAAADLTISVEGQSALRR
ncbi:hypothetical protein KFE25_010297 [Diacronema lutheri]|uniref:Uncharacterized protein n=1 Tax=Diacronema lutheri TaxID=2081491 RepID=A0A8J6C5B3_DIALT|nr:hypothetical protein KFE25_010297 [Diacronema lutheri]